MMKTKFLVIILTHKRPDRQITYKTLKKQGYTGDILFLLDNEDPTIEQYKLNFPSDKFFIFDKTEFAKITDTCDNFQRRDAILFARNFCYQIATQFGYQYFLQLDDDYTSFQYRLREKHHLKVKMVKNLDTIFDSIFNFYKKTSCTSIALAQGGDFIGGVNNPGIKKGWKFKRKCMNTFFCDTSKLMRFAGIFNEDVSQYVVEGRRGNIFLTIPLVMITQIGSQQGQGGMTEIYLQEGTYCKSFYTIIQAPSCVKISSIGTVARRIHHKINFKTCAPKIIREEWKK